MKLGKLELPWAVPQIMFYYYYSQICLATRCTDSQSTDVVSSNFDSENVPGRKPSGSQHGPECINNIPPWIYYSVIAMIGLVLFFADAAQVKKRCCKTQWFSSGV